MKKLPYKNNKDDTEYQENMMLNYEAIMKHEYKKHVPVLETLNTTNTNNPHIVKEAIKLDGLALQYASENLKNDPDIVLLAIQENMEAFNFASNELKNNKEFLLKVIEKEPYCLQDIDEKFLGDEDIIYNAIVSSKNPIFFNLASQELQSNVNFILKLVKKGESILKHLPEYWFDNEIITLTAVHSSNTALQYFPDKIKNNVTEMLKYININHENIQYASKDLLDNKEFITLAIARNGLTIRYASERLKDDKSLAYGAVMNNFGALNHINKKYKNDINLIKILIAGSNFRIDFMNEYIGEELRGNKDFINYALCTSVEYIKYANDKLQNDKEYIVKLVTDNPSIYEHLNSKMRGDLDVNYIAMNYNYNLLNKADVSIKNNADFLCYMLDNHCTNKFSNQIVKKNIGPELLEQINMSNWETDLRRLKFVHDLDKKLPKKELPKTQKLKI